VSGCCGTKRGPSTAISFNPKPEETAEVLALVRVSLFDASAGSAPFWGSDGPDGIDGFSYQV
jgi:hypothetical protein